MKSRERARLLLLATALGLPAQSGCLAHAGQEGLDPAESTGGMGKESAAGSRDGTNEKQEVERAVVNADPHQLKATHDLAVRAAVSISCFMNVTAMFASPRVIAKLETLPTREVLVQYVDDYVAVVGDVKQRWRDGGGPSPTAAEPHARKLHELFGSWTPSRAVPHEIIETARAALRAMGISEPPEGWDRFEGAPDDGRGPGGD